jgi:hypothetical protein
VRRPWDERACRQIYTLRNARMVTYRAEFFDERLSGRDDILLCLALSSSLEQGWKVQ